MQDIVVSPIKEGKTMSASSEGVSCATRETLDKNGVRSMHRFVVPELCCAVGVVSEAAGSALAQYKHESMPKTPWATVSIHGPRQITSASLRSNASALSSRDAVACLNVVARSENAGIHNTGTAGPSRSQIQSWLRKDQDPTETEASDAQPRPTPHPKAQVALHGPLETFPLCFDVPLTGFHNTCIMTETEQAIATAVKQSLLTNLFLDRCGQVQYDVVVIFSTPLNPLSFDVHSHHEVLPPPPWELDLAVTAASLAVADAQLEQRDLLCGTTLWIMSVMQNASVNGAEGHEVKAQREIFRLLVAGIQDTDPAKQIQEKLALCSTLHITSGSSTGDVAYTLLNGPLPCSMSTPSIPSKAHLEERQSSLQADSVRSGNEKRKREAQNILAEAIGSCVLVNQSRRQVLVQAMQQAHTAPPMNYDPGEEKRTELEY